MREEQRLLDRLLDANEEERRRIILSMTQEQILRFDGTFELWAHQSQLPPKREGWRTWLMMAGRGFGKTRAGAEWVHGIASKKPGVRVALVGATIGDARSIMVEGVSGLINVARLRGGARVKWEPGTGRLKWPNGSEAHLFSGDNADGLRGPEHDLAWVMTFEVEADAGPVPLGTLLGDASNGAIDCTATQEFAGFAAYGASIKQAIQPLVDCFGVELYDDGTALRSPTSAALSVVAEELGNNTETVQTPRYQREQSPTRELPSMLRLTYYDADRDYQTGEVRAAAGEQAGNEAQRELVAVLTAADAKALAHQMVARAWAERDTLRIHLPPEQFGLLPGDRVDLPFNPPRWSVQKVTIDGFVVVAELKPFAGSAIAVSADGGRIVPNSDIIPGPVSIALLDLPGLSPNSPTLLLGASSPTPGWQRAAVELSYSGQSMSIRSAARKSVLGSAVTILAGADPASTDTVNTVDVQLIDEDQWLTSCDDAALTAGANLALIGDELVQFGDITPLSGGRFRLGRLLRGRAGTESAVSGHAINDVFCLIETGSLQSIPLPVTSIGREVTASIPGGASASLTVRARADAIASPAGGTTVDDEARTSIDQILATLRQHGLIAS